MRHTLARNGKESAGRAVDVLVVALASGMSVRDAAKAAGVGERTAHRRLKDPKFRRRVSEVRNQVFDEAVGKLTQGATRAADTLVELLSDASPMIRLNAARSVLTLGVDARAFAEFAERLKALEKKRRNER